MTLIYDEFNDVYIWVDVNNHDNELSPQFDDEESAIQWYGTVSKHIFEEYGLTGFTPKSREQIITSMCYTWRHDYGLVKYPDPGGYTYPCEPGMTPNEREALWNQMAQIFDNDIAPFTKPK